MVLTLNLNLLIEINFLLIKKKKWAMLNIFNNFDKIKKDNFYLNISNLIR